MDLEEDVNIKIFSLFRERKTLTQKGLLNINDNKRVAMFLVDITNHSKHKFPKLIRTNLARHDDDDKLKLFIFAK